MFGAHTSFPKSKTVVRRWYRVDADGVSLGRLAAMSANLLRGKGKTSFASHVDQGDGVVVINAAKVVLTGNKKTQKMDFRASGYRGGQTLIPYERLLKDKPERAVELAVSGMLPKNRLRSRFMRRLKVFRADEGAVQYPMAHVVDTKNPKIKSGGPYVLAAAK
ncbi:MAG: 50S ribosomal protein L13 [Elusimicrobia bacterium]|nr:50S ribosomal protein L13 [Elusimicrobiota bacterium]MBP9698701.1 50S ribosomal protein L13 [Elusimicrobiota bacterium]